jgi:hypothetical protein
MKPDPDPAKAHGPDFERQLKMSLQKELGRQDEFDSVMAWLGKMVSACNYMGQTFQVLPVNLLQCKRPETAIIVSRERRAFPAMVDLIEELFAVNVQEEGARNELKTVGALAKKLYDERNKHIHSIWYMSLRQTTAAERFKNTKGAGPVGVEATEISTLADNFDRCSQKVSALIHWYFDSEEPLGIPETEKLL